jgi:hypothetical protein
MIVKRTTPMQAVNQLFVAQHGVVTTRQSRRAGVTLHRERGLIHRGCWLTPSPGFIALAGVPATWIQAVSMASLLPGALICGPTAARVHSLDGYRDRSEIEVLVPHGARPRRIESVVVRSSRRLSQRDRHVVNGIAVTTVPVTLVHLAVRGDDVAQPLDGALRSGASPRWLRQEIERWRQLGVPAADTVIDLLDDRVSQRLPLSWFQRLAKRLLADAGTAMVDEWPVRDAAGRLVATLDLAIVELRVGVECQSWEHHGSPAAQRADNARKRKLRALGWEIVEVWWSDLDRMDEVVTDLHIAVRRAQFRIEA